MIKKKKKTKQKETKECTGRKEKKTQKIREQGHKQKY